MHGYASARLAALAVLAAQTVELSLFAPERVRPVRGERLRPAPAAPPPCGRNERCPCGSGKKYKKCCRGK